MAVSSITIEAGTAPRFTKQLKGQLELADTSAPTWEELRRQFALVERLQADYETAKEHTKELKALVDEAKIELARLGRRMKQRRVDAATGEVQA